MASLCLCFRNKNTSLIRTSVFLDPDSVVILILDESSPLQHAHGVSTQLQSSGLVAHENSTFRNLAPAVSGPFMA